MKSLFLVRYNSIVLCKDSTGELFIIIVIVITIPFIVIAPGSMTLFSGMNKY